MTSPATGEGERLLSPGEVAGRFLTRIETVRKWVEDGRLRSVPDGKLGFRVPEGAVDEFRAEAYRRENFNGVDHGLHSWPSEQPPAANLPALAQNAAEAEAIAPRWPFPHS